MGYGKHGQIAKTGTGSLSYFTINTGHLAWWLTLFDTLHRRNDLPIAMFGTKVVVDGTYSDAYGLNRRACEEHRWFNATSAFVNPYQLESSGITMLTLHSQSA